MVISTAREPEETRLVAALRGVFDASVFNFGSYNILFAVNSQSTPHDAGPRVPSPHPATLRSGSAPAPMSAEGICAFPHLLVGYRRNPVDMVLCPVHLDTALTLDEPGTRELARASPGTPVSVDLTNLAGLATVGDCVEITLSTGQVLSLEVHPSWTLPQAPDTTLHQRRDVEDFYEFIDHFMDLIEGADRDA